MTKRPEKKSETIEVRVSYTEKLAFMEACRQAGTTASHAIRDYIGDFLNPASSKTTRNHMATAIGLILIAGLAGTTAYFSLNQLNHITVGEKVVRYFDHNGDNVITTVDTINLANKDTINWLLATGDKNKNGALDAAEIDAFADVTIELRAEHLDGATASTGEKIIVMPPNLTPTERDAFLKQLTDIPTISNNDQDRLKRLIDALSTPSVKAESTKKTN
ncbi:hypothetical protein [Kordiimonas aquimaris]|uniref:hypothetical protein n=1 Tax=Kordiimonas aquimaris TaxID=707591 RepID=UPI0021CF73E4|nr:hypothetical protein [Kordiimonas aquimaris]